jgi:hypothetical protein
MNKLTPYEKAELWAKVSNLALGIHKNATQSQETGALYIALDDLERLCRKFRRHHVALLVESQGSYDAL